jgi:hypothetical protein
MSFSHVETFTKEKNPISPDGINASCVSQEEGHISTGKAVICVFNY